MMLILSLLLVMSVCINCIFVWYTRKLVQNLYFGVNNVDELQKLLNEYSSLLEPLANMENYYGDPAITSAIANTKMVIEACKTYKNSIIESENEEETQKQEENNKEEDKKESKAVIQTF